MPIGLVFNDIKAFNEIYQITFVRSTQDKYATPPKFMTGDSYIDYAYNPERKTRNIDMNEAEALHKIIEDGLKSSNKEIQQAAKKYKQQLDELEAITIEQEFGVTKEEFDKGNCGTYNTRKNQVNNKILLLLNDLEKLDNASLKDVVMNLFTGELTKKRDEITKELIKLTAEVDLLNSKISTKAILALQGKELGNQLKQKQE